MLLVRYREYPSCTLGKLICKEYTFETMEREGPDSRKPNGKRIEAGIYTITTLRRQDYRIDISGVPGRTGIQLHTGSRPEHSSGCILVLGSRQLGLSSKAAIRLLQVLGPRKIRIIGMEKEYD